MHPYELGGGVEETMLGRIGVGTGSLLFVLCNGDEDMGVKEIVLRIGTMGMTRERS